MLPPMPDTGAHFDRYVIEAVLGEGGMGRVYRALDPRLGRRVALKVLLAGPDGVGHSEAAARMMREARAAAAFNHPNVVAIYDVGEHEGSPFIAMELVVGSPLRAMIGKDVPVAQKLAWLLDVARGLGAAHRAGLVHRDIKPENVMITTDGGVKILDFGIARLAQGGADAHAATVTPNLPSLTAAGVAIGTPQYMPPEQLKGEPLDGRADQYAWGVTAYELLCGKHPWATASGAHLVAAILTLSVPPLRQLLPDLDPRVSDAVARAMEKSQAARFGTMEELVHAIDAGAPRAIISGSTLESATNGSLATANTTQAPAELRIGGAKSPSRSGAGLRALAGVAVVALVAGAVVLAPRLLAKKRPAPVVASAPSSIAEAAAPSSRPGRPPANPAAAAAYAAALQEEHDAKLSAAVPTLGKVTDADPSFAPAFIHLAGIYLLVVDPEGARENFRKAWDLRASLGEVDAAMLEAMEPAVREPPVATEYVARMAAVSDRYPGELLPAIFAASAYTDAEQLDRASALYDRAIAADPTAALPYFGKGELSVHAGDLEGGGRLFDECTRVSPMNVECLAGRILVYADTGRCEEAKGVTRRVLANSPEPGFDESLAAAAAATGEPVEVVGEYLKRANEGTRPEIAGSETAQHDTQLACLRGDFRAADASTKKWDAALKAEKRESSIAMLKRFAIAEEVGQLAAYRAEILATWTRSQAWLEPSDPARLRLAHREHQVGLITKDELGRRRDAWKKARIEQSARGGAPVSEETLWRAMFVNDAETPDEAREALAYYAEGGTPKLSVEDGAPRDHLAFGLAYVRAGDYARALPLLRDGTRMCRDLEDRFAQTQALFFFGQALEHTGDVAGARQAYGEVVAAWGKAKPPSVSAARARARLAALAK